MAGSFHALLGGCLHPGGAAGVAYRNNGTQALTAGADKLAEGVPIAPAAPAPAPQGAS